MVSIIMPVYNADKYLEVALKSILNQSYKDYELICVNDGSFDESEKILQNYSKADNRISVINNKERYGAGESRNIGIKSARGDYLLFLDADDVFDENLLEITYSCAKNNDLDILLYEYLIVSTEKIGKQRFIHREEEFIEACKNRIVDIHEMDMYNVVMWNNAPWNKIYKRDFIINNNLWFQNLQSSNDVYFVEMSFLCAKRLMVLKDNKVLVHVREHHESSRISLVRNPMCVYDAFKKIIEDLSERNILSENIKYVLVKFYYALCRALNNLYDDHMKKEFYSFFRKEGLDCIESLIKTATGYNIVTFIDKFNNFKNDYNNLFFKDENGLNFVLEQGGERLLNKICGKSICVWGVGAYGKAVLKYLVNNNIKVDHIVDINEKQHGLIINDCIVKKPEIADIQNIEIVLVCVRHAYVEVKEFLNEYKGEIVDISGMFVL